MKRILIAGIGNLFLGDDGFGVEVARRLLGVALPEGVRVRDVGTRGLDLALELLDGWDAAILVDAMQRGGAPGTLYVLEPAPPEGASVIEAHAMTPDAALRARAALGGGPLEVKVVGCEPLTLEPGMALSAPVSAAVEPAIELVLSLVGARLDREAARA